MKRCLIYARVSTKQQTTENQLPPLRKFAKDRGWKVVQEMIDHGYSGTTATRPQLTEVMNLARRREFDILLVYALDRFGRSVKHLVNALDEFHELGIDFCAYNQNIDTTTATGKLFFTMISGFAEFEAAIIKERVHAGLARARAEGKQLGRPRTVQVDVGKVRVLRKLHSIREIAGQLGTSKSAVYRILQTIKG
jgi:DNA invertase Pin-like site-specific DNA recombinase